MFSQVIYGFGNRIHEGRWDLHGCEPSRTIKEKTVRVGTSHIFKANKRESCTYKSHSYSPLRLLFWTTLFIGARGQLTDPFPSQIELSSLDGTNGFMLNGEAEGDMSGISVSSAGDVNGDGLDDLVIGSVDASLSGKSRAGKSYVIFGTRTPISGGMLDLSSLNGSNGFIVNGEAADDRSGISVSSVGDMNGDGLSDVVIGAAYAAPSGMGRAGKSYVIFGTRAPISGGMLNLSSLNGSNGFIVNGEIGGDRSGISVSSAGDVNGDGLADFVIGANHASPPGRLHAGKSYVVFGTRTLISGGMLDLSSLNSSNGFIVNGEEAGDNSGYSVSAAGDVNGDGLSDFVIGASRASPSGYRSGKSYVIYGIRTPVSGGLLELSSLNGSNGFILKGEEVNDRSGASVSSAGDVNGDGLADIVIGAWQADPSGRIFAGKSYLVFGSRNISNLVGIDGAIELMSLNGSSGFILKGEARDDRSGRVVSSAGDVNGDGLADLLIGASDADLTGRSNAGKSYVIFGTRSMSSLVGSGSTIELSSLDGSNGFILNGGAAGDSSGRSVSSAGDVNGDGVSDILVGASGASPQGKSRAGKTYVIYGRKLSHASSTLSTLATSSLVITSSLSSTFTGQMKSTVTTSTGAFPRLTPISLSTSLINSLVHTTSSSLLTSDSQSSVLPIVLVASGVICLSGIGVVVIVFRKCKNPDQETGHELNQVDPIAHTKNSNKIYKMITLMPKYDSCDLNPDEYDSVRSVPLESNNKKSTQTEYIDIQLTD